MGIKIDKSQMKKILKIPKNIKKNYNKEVRANIEGEIVSEILKGKSPVRSHTFEQYSDSYSRIKKGKKPVDMFRTGKMLKSFFTKHKNSGPLTMGFDSVTSEYHQDGTDKMPQRKLLPIDSGDTFNTKLTKFINNALKKAVKKTKK